MQSPFSVELPAGITLLSPEQRSPVRERLPQGVEWWVLTVPADFLSSETLVIHSSVSGNLAVDVGVEGSVRIALFLEGSAALVHELELSVGDRAHCDVLCVQAASLPSSSLRERGTIGAEAHCIWRNVTLAQSAEHELVSRVAGEGSRSDVDWVFYAKGSEKQTIVVRNIFDAPHGEGEITMRGVAEQKGHVVARGFIDIGLKGGGTNTYLTQSVLMLDKTAKVDAIPGLEIKTNDVKASHSATVSRVTEEDLFYFAARGIPEREARAMFVEGFLGDLLEKVGDTQLRSLLRAMIEEKYALQLPQPKPGS